MEIIDIGLNDLEPINIDFGSSSSSSSSNVNFGPGIELLMNEKKKSASNSTSIDLGELDRLEDELNELSGANDSNTKSLSGLRYVPLLGNDFTHWSILSKLSRR